MKMIAIQTVKVGGKYVAPGSAFDIDDDGGKALIESGAAERKTRQVADDEDEHNGDPATDSSLPASGATKAPDPAGVAGAAKTAKRP